MFEALRLSSSLTPCEALCRRLIIYLLVMGRSASGLSFHMYSYINSSLMLMTYTSLLNIRWLLKSNFEFKSCSSSMSSSSCAAFYRSVNSPYKLWFAYWITSWIKLLSSACATDCLFLLECFLLAGLKKSSSWKSSRLVWKNSSVKFWLSNFFKKVFISLRIRSSSSCSFELYSFSSSSSI